MLSRGDAIDRLNTIIVAPITSTIRGLRSEVSLTIDDGMKDACAVNLDHIQTVPKSELRKYVTTLSPEKMSAVCRALSVATGCS